MELPAKRKSVFECPELVLGAFVVVAMIAWTLQHSLLQKVFGIDIYETIVWGQQHQWGHSKHPPLSGWLGYFFSWVTGHRDWGLYLASQLCFGIGIFFTFLTARQFFDRYRSSSAAALLFFFYYMPHQEMKFCTYLVEIAIAPMASYLLIKGLRQNRWWQWLLLGLVCGLGILNKYSFGLIMAGFAIVVLTRKEYRRRLASPWPYLAVLVFLAVIAPHLKWLIDHRFVCFRHVGSRLDEKPGFLMPLQVLIMALVPVVLEAVLLMLASTPRLPEPGRGRAVRWLRSWKALDGWTPAAINREALCFAGIITLLPGAVYFLLSLTGTDIILQWLCSVASLSGIIVVSLFPVEVDRRLFKRLSILTAMFAAVFFIGTTVDLLCRTTDSCHIDPVPVVESAEAFWKKHSDEPIPVVVGGLRFAALVSHYSAQHPPVCDPEDDLMIGLYREKIRKHGALLVDSRPQDFDKFLKRCRRLDGGEVKVKFTARPLKYRARFGKTKKRPVVFGYLPPGTEIE